MMKKLRMRTHSLAISLLGILPTVSSWTCSTQIRGETTYITCPQHGEMGDKIYCCGTEKQRYCCNSEEFASTIYCRNAIGVIIGILVPSIIVVGIVVVVTCFCCSSCLLSKCRQQRAPVVYGNCCLCACPRVARVNAATTMTTVTYHTQPMTYPIYPMTEYTAYPLTETPPPYYSSD